MKKLIIFLFLFMVLSSFAIAIPPVQSLSDSTEALQIEYPKIEYGMVNTPLTWNLHIFNSSGIPIGNTSTQCQLHIYNNTGGHIIKATNIPFNADEKEWYFNTQINNTGAYSFLAFCNNSNKGGFISSAFFINDYGTVEKELGGVALGVIIFLVLINLIFFLMPIFIRFVQDEVQNIIIKRTMWIFSLAILAFNTTLIITMVDRVGLGITSNLFLFQWIFLKAIYVGIILLFFSFVISIPKLWELKKQRKRMGENEK